MINKMSRVVIVMVLIMGLVVGCANLKKTAYSSLDTTRVTVDTAMKVAGDLYARDMINDEQRDAIIAVHDQYRSVHQTLCEFLKMYDALYNNESAKKTVEEQIVIGMEELARLSAEISKIITEYIQLSTQK